MPNDEKPDTGYTLTPAETALFAAFNANAQAAKVRIHDLNVELEVAQGERKTAEAHFGAALVAIATARGIAAPVSISPDFSRLEGAN